MNIASNATILIVDDSINDSQLLQRILAKQGYTFFEAENGATALEIAQREQPDLVLLDVMMAQMDGFEVCKRLKAMDATRDIPVIFLSALSDTRDHVRAFEVGGVDYITKPFQAEEILARIETHLTLRRTQQALKETNADLRRERNLLRALIDTVPDGMYAKDAEGQFLLANKQLASDLGFDSPEALQGKTDADIHAPEQAEAYRQEEQQILDGGTLYNKEVNLTNADGSPIWLLVSKVPFRDAEGNIIGIVGVNHNITDAKLAELALQESQARYRLLLEASPDPIVVYDLDLNVTYVNPAFTEVFGWTLAELEGGPLDYIPDDKQQEKRELLARLNREGKTPSVETKRLTKDGRGLYVLLSTALFYGTTGNKAGQFVIVRDISERKKAEQTLAYFKKAIDTTSDGVRISDANAHVYYQNPALVKMLGYTTEELNQMNGTRTTYTNPDIVTDILEELWQGNAWNGEVEMRNKAGEPIPVWMQVDMSREEGNNPTVVAIITDITERRNTEKFLRKTHNQLTMRVAELETLNNLTQTISKATNMTEMLRIVAENMLKMFQAQSCGVALLDDDETQLTVVVDVLRQSDGTSNEVGAKIPAEGNPSTEKAFKTQRPVIITDAQNHPDTATIHDSMRRRGTECLIIVPLLARGRVIGTLGVDIDDPDYTPSDNQVRLAETISGQIAGAIENARLFEQEQTQRKKAEQLVYELGTLNKIIQTAVHLNDMDAVLQTIIDSMGDVLRAKHTSVALLSEDRKTLTVRADYTNFYSEAEKKLKEDVIGLELDIAEHPNSQKVIDSKKTLILDDVQNNPETTAIHELMMMRGTHCLMIVPLLVRGEAVGTIGVDLDTPGRTFTEDEIRLAETIAGQMSGAIENVRLLEEEQAQRQMAEQWIAEVAALNHISRTVSTVTNLQEALDTVAEQMTHLFDAYSALVTINNLERNMVVIKTHYITDNEAITLAGTEWPLDDDPITPVVIERQRPLLLPDPQPDEVPKPLKDRIKALSLTCLMAVPLWTRGEIIGGIMLTTDQPERQFTIDEMTMAETIAGQIAGAIDNARLFEQEQQQRQVAESLQQVATVLNASLDRDTILAKIMEQLRQMVTYDSGAVFLSMEGVLTLSYGVGIDEAYIGYQVPIQSDLPEAKVFNEQQPMVIEDVRKNPHWNEWTETDPVRAWMSVPLLVEQRAIGILTADSFEVGAYTERDAEILQTFADQATLAIRNAQLFDEAEKQREISESLREVANVLSRTLDQEAVISKIVEQLGRVLDYNGGGIFLLEGDELVLIDGALISEEFLGNRIHVDDSSPVARTFRMKQPLAINDVQKDDGWIIWPGGEVIRGWIGAPLFKGREPIGVLTADSFTVGEYNEEDVRIMQMFANQAAIAIQNAQLFEQAQQARDAAETANQAKSAFLASMSHELRTPLNGILGYAQILRRDATLSQKQQEGIRVIQQSGEHLLLLLNDILDLSKIEAGRMEIYPTDFHLPNFLQGLADMFELRAAQQGIWFSYDPDPSLPVGVRGDEKRLRQVLNNLLGNAVKFTEEGGVALKVSRQGSKIRFAVEDTGVGIKPEELTAIFDSFQQVGDEQKRAEGTGLGLAISQRLVSMMGGTLQVSSKFGEGTIFWFDLDLPSTTVREPTEALPQVAIKGYEGAQRNVLIVDDKRENRTVLVNMLEPLGFQISEAKNGQEAVEMTAANQPDLILMDLVMPVMDGFEAIRHISKLELPDTHIIAISASAFDEDQRKSIALGSDDFIAKPFRLDSLLAKIKTVLGLAWVYHMTTEQAESSENGNTQPLVLPPTKTLERLLNLANRGKVTDIKRELADLTDEYDLFTTEIGTLAKGFKVKQMRQRLQKYLEGQT